MTIRTADDVLRVARGRGFAVLVDEDGKTMLRGDPAEATPALMDALRLFKPEILKALRDKHRDN